MKIIIKKDGFVKISFKNRTVVIEDNTNDPTIQVLTGEPMQYGQTTRLIDHYIQKLFKSGYIEPKDHYGSRESNMFLTCRIRDRLYKEHPHEIDNLVVNNETALGFRRKYDEYFKKNIIF